MSKRAIVRIVSYVCAALTVALIFVVILYKDMRFYKNQVKYTYSQAFDELNDSISNIKLNLEKAKYVTTEKQINNIAVTLYTESKIAKSSFAKFPMSDRYGETLNKFLSQVGNYSVYISRKLNSGDELGTQEKDGIDKLISISETINDNINSAHEKYTAGVFKVEQLGSNIFDNIEESDFTVSFDELEESLVGYPTLIYDGPYSDYIGTKKSKMLEEAENVSEDAAKQTVSDMFGVDLQGIELESYEGGNIACYHFTFEGGSAAVTQKGGYPVYFRRYTEQSEPLYTYEQAVSRAQKYLSKHSADTFVPTYYYTDNGVCVINFAHKNAATVCYTDLIKIGIDLSTGDMVLYEGRGYITNHTERTLPTPQNSAEAAQKVVSDSLTVNSYALALIPTSGGYEKQCYEFTCTAVDGTDVLVYVDTATLQEEQIFIIINTSGGTLVK